MTLPTQINVPGAPFNTPQHVYNGEGVEAKSFRFLIPLPPQDFNAAIATPAGPQVLTDFAAIPSDVQSNAFVVNDVQDTVPRTPVTGSFSAVRARRILHQYRIGFWSDAGIIDQLTASNAADPTQDQIDTNWANFQLFSYLPDALMPTKEQFSDLITPSKNATNVLDALPLMGINTSVVTNPVPTVVAPAAPASLPDPTPFASNLSQFCAP